MLISDLTHLDLAQDQEVEGGLSFNFANALTQLSLTSGGLLASANANAAAQGFSNVYTFTWAYTNVVRGPVNFGIASAFAISIGFF